MGQIPPHSFQLCLWYIPLLHGFTLNTDINTGIIRPFYCLELVLLANVRENGLPPVGSLPLATSLFSLMAHVVRDSYSHLKERSRECTGL
jgi:hypothetical protein